MPEFHLFGGKLVGSLQLLVFGFPSYSKGTTSFIIGVSRLAILIHIYATTIKFINLCFSIQIEIPKLTGCQVFSILRAF